MRFAYVQRILCFYYMKHNAILSFLYQVTKQNSVQFCLVMLNGDRLNAFLCNHIHVQVFCLSNSYTNSYTWFFFNPESQLWMVNNRFCAAPQRNWWLLVLVWFSRIFDSNDLHFWVLMFFSVCNICGPWIIVTWLRILFGFLLLFCYIKKTGGIFFPSENVYAQKKWSFECAFIKQQWQQNKQANFRWKPHNFWKVHLWR